MRFILSLLTLSTCTNVHAQYGKRYTLQTVEFYFADLARAGIPMDVPPLEPTPGSRVGDIGELKRKSDDSDSISYIVLQQIDQGTLVNVEYYRRPHTERWKIGGDGSDYRTVPERTLRFGPFLLRSDEYRDLPTDARFAPRGVWQISSTFEYETAAGGTRSVLSLTPLPIEELHIPEHPQLLVNGPREWTDSSGQFKASAVYIGYESGQVTLIRTDGTKVTTPIGRLSADDQKWVRDQIKSERQKQSSNRQ